MSYATSIIKAVARLDSWFNSVTGIGLSGRDKTLSNRVQLDAPLDVPTIEALLAGSAIPWRICNSLPSKALKRGFGLTSAAGDIEPKQAQEQSEELLKECRRVGLLDKLIEADTWGRAYGFGALLLVVKGAGAPWEPLDDEAEGELVSVLVVDRREMAPESYYTDPDSEKLGEPEMYRVNPTVQGETVLMRVHETRLIRFPGAMTARRDRLNNQGADYSVLQRAFTTLQQVEANWASACQLMSDMSQGVYTIEGLMDMIATGAEPAMQTRMTMLDYQRSSGRSILLDSETEGFERKPTPMGGVNEMLEQGWKKLAADYEMTLTELMGISPAGLNATGEADMRKLYDNVLAHQHQVLAPRIQRVIRLISRSLGHRNPEAWLVKWPSPWQPTAAEQADIYSKYAAADNTYIANGTYLPEEVALTRNGTGEDFNIGKIQIDVEARKAALTAALKEMEDPTPPPAPVIVAAPGAAPKLPPKKEIQNG